MADERDRAGKSLDGLTLLLLLGSPGEPPDSICQIQNENDEVGSVDFRVAASAASAQDTGICGMGHLDKITLYKSLSQGEIYPYKEPRIVDICAMGHLDKINLCKALFKGEIYLCNEPTFVDVCGMGSISKCTFCKAISNKLFHGSWLLRSREGVVIQTANFEHMRCLKIILQKLLGNHFEAILEVDGACDDVVALFYSGNEEINYKYLRIPSQLNLQHIEVQIPKCVFHKKACISPWLQFGVCAFFLADLASFGILDLLTMSKVKTLEGGCDNCTTDLWLWRRTMLGAKLESNVLQPIGIEECRGIRNCGGCVLAFNLTFRLETSGNYASSHELNLGGPGIGMRGDEIKRLPTPVKRQVGVWASNWTDVEDRGILMNRNEAHTKELKPGADTLVYISKGLWEWEGFDRTLKQCQQTGDTLKRHEPRPDRSGSRVSKRIKSATKQPQDDANLCVPPYSVDTTSEHTGLTSRVNGGPSSNGGLCSSTAAPSASVRQPSAADAPLSISTPPHLLASNNPPDSLFDNAVPSGRPSGKSSECVFHGNSQELTDAQKCKLSKENIDPDFLQKKNKANLRIDETSCRFSIARIAGSALHYNSEANDEALRNGPLNFGSIAKSGEAVEGFTDVPSSSLKDEILNVESFGPGKYCSPGEVAVLCDTSNRSPNENENILAKNGGEKPDAKLAVAQDVGNDATNMAIDRLASTENVASMANGLTPFQHHREVQNEVPTFKSDFEVMRSRVRNDGNSAMKGASVSNWSNEKIRALFLSRMKSHEGGSGDHSTHQGLPGRALLEMKPANHIAGIGYVRHHSLRINDNVSYNGLPDFEMEQTRTKIEDDIPKDINMPSVSLEQKASSSKPLTVNRPQAEVIGDNFVARAKRRRAPRWIVEEKGAYLELKVEALQVVEGMDWKFISQGLRYRHGFDRSSKCCEDLWGTLLKDFRAIRDHEASKSDAQTSNWVSYWEMDEDGRSRNKLPRLFPLEWCKMIERILAAKEKRSRKKSKGTPQQKSFGGEEYSHLHPADPCGDGSNQQTQGKRPRMTDPGGTPNLKHSGRKRSSGIIEEDPSVKQQVMTSIYDSADEEWKGSCRERITGLLSSDQEKGDELTPLFEAGVNRYSDIPSSVPSEHDEEILELRPEHAPAMMTSPFADPCGDGTKQQTGIERPRMSTDRRRADTPNSKYADRKGSSVIIGEDPVVKQQVEGAVNFAFERLRCRKMSGATTEKDDVIRMVSTLVKQQMEDAVNSALRSLVRIDDHDLMISLAPFLKRSMDDELHSAYLHAASVLQAGEQEEQEYQEKLRALEDKRRALDLEEMEIKRQRVGGHKRTRRASYKQQGSHVKNSSAGGHPGIERIEHRNGPGPG